MESGTNRHEPICCRAAALSVADVAPVYLKWPSIGSRAAYCLSQLRRHETKVRRNSIFLTLRRSLRRGLPRGILLKYLSFRLHKSWYQEETSRGPQHKALRALRCSWFRSVSTLSELLVRVPANSKLDLKNFIDSPPKSSCDPEQQALWRVFRGSSAFSVLFLILGCVVVVSLFALSTF